MINYIRKILTGYSCVKRTINGVDFKYYYSGKPIFFDPFVMLQDYNFRISGDPLQHLKLNASERDLYSSILCLDYNLFPSVICHCMKNGNELKVSRYSLKDGLPPLSLYRFEMNGVFFGSFRRKYDYGSRLKNFGTKLASLNQTQLDLSKGKWLWTGENGEQLFLEKFGHSQLWYFTDPKKVGFWKHL